MNSVSTKPGTLKSGTPVPLSVPIRRSIAFTLKVEGSGIPVVGPNKKAVKPSPVPPPVSIRSLKIRNTPSTLPLLSTNNASPEIPKKPGVYDMVCPSIATHTVLSALQPSAGNVSAIAGSENKQSTADASTSLANGSFIVDRLLGLERSHCGEGRDRSKQTNWCAIAGK